MTEILVPSHYQICPNCGEECLDLNCPQGCSTKARSWGAHRESGKAATQRERILYLLKAAWPDGLSRNDIERIFAVPENRPRVRLSAVCGRVNSLLKDQEVEVHGSKYDEETQRVVEVLRYRQPHTQVLDNGQISFFR